MLIAGNSVKSFLKCFLCGRFPVIFKTKKKMQDLKEKRKEKHTAYRIHPLLEGRWSPRVFSEEPIPEELLHSLFEAGRWAPSSYNMQPWRIVWGKKGSKTYDRIFNCLDPFNRKWAGNAAVLLLGAYKKTNPEGKENFHALHDLGAFSAMMTIQAESLGIAVHQMAGVQNEKADKEFGFPEDYHVATGIAMGYYGGDVEDLPEELQKMEAEENTRKPQEAFTFNGDFSPEEDEKQPE
jgi:nitroreductase